MSMLVESVIKVSLPNYTVRVWRQQEEGYEHEGGGITDVHMTAHSNQDLHMKALALKLMLLPNVSAVEVVNWENCGVVLYSDWP